jgi:hypothetical protein
MAEEDAQPILIGTGQEYLMEDFYLVNADFDKLGDICRLIDGLYENSPPVADVFIENLCAVFTTAMSICVFAKRTARQTAYTGFYGVELGVTRMRRVLRNEEKNSDQIHAELKQKLGEEPWREGFESSVHALYKSNLTNFLRDEIGRSTARTMIRQCTVLVWSAFEVLVTDLFRQLLNKDPTLTARLMKDERTRRLYSPKDLYSALEQQNYNLSGVMGDVLLSQCNLDSLDHIRIVFDALFGGCEDLRKALHDVRLWNLCKIRNLIVHRAGVVDEAFCTCTRSERRCWRDSSDFTG